MALDGDEVDRKLLKGAIFLLSCVSNSLLAAAVGGGI